MVKLDHVTIPVSDWMRSRDWYVRNLGFSFEFELPEGGREGRGVVALQDDSGLTLFMEQLSGPIHCGQAMYAFQVDDVEALHVRLAGEGQSFQAPPGKQYWGYGAVLSDPDGHVLNLWDPHSTAEKR